jgi:hypothetical protein
MRLGNHGGQLFIFWIDGESCESVGGFWKDRLMQTESVKIVAQSGKVQAPVKSLEPAPLLLVMVDMMLRSASLPLGFPSLDEGGFLKDRAMEINPMAQVGTGAAIHHAEATQLRDALRELWDFRKS